jgi:hypothetical protein
MIRTSINPNMKRDVFPISYLAIKKEAREFDGLIIGIVSIDMGNTLACLTLFQLERKTR